MTEPISIFIMSSRFTQDTWDENCAYRREKQYSGCIYGSPTPLSCKIPPYSPVFIVEMNNTSNKIEGIGLVCNKVQYDKYYMVYKTGNYNRYIYKSKFRLDRTELQQHNLNLVKALDHILFKEKTHVKRGSGITIIPEKLYQHKLCNNMNIRQELRNIFIQHNTD